MAHRSPVDVVARLAKSAPHRDGLSFSHPTRWSGPTAGSPPERATQVDQQEAERGYPMQCRPRSTRSTRGFRRGPADDPSTVLVQAPTPSVSCSIPPQDDASHQMPTTRGRRSYSRRPQPTTLSRIFELLE